MSSDASDLDDSELDGTRSEAEVPTSEEAAAANEEEIIGEMDTVREKLGDGIDRLGEEMRNVFDWQAYVRSAPLTSVGIALAAGFLLAPAMRSRPAPTAPQQPQPVESGGLFSSLTSMVTGTVSRIAMAYLLQMLTSQIASAGMPGTNSGQAPVDQPDQTLDLGL